MKSLKKWIKWLLYTLYVPILYAVISIGFGAITIHKDNISPINSISIYLKTNGVHLDIIIPKKDITPTLLIDLYHLPEEHYLAFGWGDENFYLNTPTWGDLTFSNAFGAMFLKSSTLLHVTRYTAVQDNWIEIKIEQQQFNALSMYIQSSFKHDDFGNKVLLKDEGYTSFDNFYKAYGSYSCLTTCNTWVNSGFKESGLKSCFWTPFDFGLLNKYQ